MTITVADTDLNASATVDVNVTTSFGESEIVTLNEIGPNRGVFTGIMPTLAGTAAGTNDDNLTVVAVGTVVTVTYHDASPAGDVNATTTAVAVVTTPVVSDGGGGGGGLFSTTDNVGLVAMILGFLAMGGLIVRRRLA